MKYKNNKFEMNLNYEILFIIFYEYRMNKNDEK